jgi:Fe-S cluster biogenesis protein NfuA
MDNALTGENTTAGDASIGEHGTGDHGTPEQGGDGRGADGHDADGQGVVSDEERARREQDLHNVIGLMRPAVQADGGDLQLVDFDVVTGVVSVELQGACSSCAISSATLQGGVERILRERLAWVTEVHGGVDESMDPFESSSMGQGGYVPKW